MKLAIKSGSTSKKVKVFIRDSSSTTGAGLTGLAYNSSGLTWYYTKDGDSSATQVTLATATLGTWASGGFVVVDGTNMPGVYEIGIPNAAIASGTCHMMLKGVTNMAPVLIEIQTDNVPADTVAVGGQTASAAGTVTFPGTIASTTNITAATGITVSTNSDKTGYSLTQTFPSNFSALAITAGGIVSADLQTIKTQTVTCAGGVTVPAATLASTANITTVGAVSGAVGSVTGAVGSVTGNVGGNVTGSVGSVAGAVASVTGAVGSVTSGVTVTTNNDKTGYSLATTPPTAATISAAVWDLAISGHITAGSFGEALNNAGSGSSPSTIAEAVWDLPTSGHTDAGSFGLAMSNAGSAGNPWSTDISTGYTGTTAGAVLYNLEGVTGVIGGGTGAGTATSVAAFTGSFGLSTAYVTSYPKGSTTADFTNTACTISSRPGVYTYTNSGLTGSHYVIFRETVSSDPFYTGFVNLDSSGEVAVEPMDLLTAADFSSTITPSIVIPSAVALASAEPSVITAKNYCTLSATVTMGTITGRTKLWFAVKSALTDDDSAALVLITEAGGLITANGAAATSSALGSITVDDASTGEITVRIDQEIMALLTITEREDPYYWGAKVLISGDTTEPVNGEFIVVCAATKANT